MAPTPLPSPSKQVLEGLYLTQRLSIVTIAGKYGVSFGTARHWLMRNDIPIRPPQPKKQQPTDKQLRKLYQIDNLTTRQIAERYGVDKALVTRWMWRAGITPRPAHGTPERPDAPCVCCGRMAEPNARRILGPLRYLCLPCESGIWRTLPRNPSEVLIELAIQERQALMTIAQTLETCGFSPHSLPGRGHLPRFPTDCP